MKIMRQYKIRRAQTADMERILEIYSLARAFMISSGNPTQWSPSYPAQCMLEEDICQQHLYVAEDDRGVHGVFFFAVMDDPTYGVIEGGSWGSSDPYGVIHRIASDGNGGVFSAALAFCLEKIPHIRIDTHHDNFPMQHVLEKHGFRKRGIIYVADGSPRIAYDRINNG